MVKAASRVLGCLCILFFLIFRHAKLEEDFPTIGSKACISEVLWHQDAAEVPASHTYHGLEHCTNNHEYLGILVTCAQLVGYCRSMDTWSCETRNHVTHSALMHCAQRCAPVNSDEELFERMLPLEAWNLQSLISCRAWELLKGQIIWQICRRSEVEVWQKQMPRSLPLQSRGQEISFSKALKLVTCGSFRCWGT